MRRVDPEQREGWRGGWSQGPSGGRRRGEEGERIDWKIGKGERGRSNSGRGGSDLEGGRSDWGEREDSLGGIKERLRQRTEQARGATRWKEQPRGRHK